MSMQRLSSFSKLHLAWFSIALFFLYQYILRVSPGIMVSELRREFQLTAEQFSTLGAFYLYAYSLFQIPLGLIVDRIGIRKTVSISILLCAVGTVLMSLSSTLWILQVSRVLVGLGSASAFMCSLKFAVDYLPAGGKGFFMGATLTLGTVGALTAGKPLVLLLNEIGWRSSFYLLAAVGIALLLAIQFLVPSQRKKTDLAQQSLAKMFEDVLNVVRNRKVMLYAFLAVGVYTPLSVLADLWGTAFLIEKYGLSSFDAAHLSMMMYCGLAISSLLLPGFCERYKILDRAIQVCSVLLLFFFALVLYGPHFSQLGVGILFVLTGICCGAEMMCFTGAAQSATSSNSGVTIGVVNTLNMLGGAILQQIIGDILDKRWSGTVDSYGVRMYSVEEYSVALSVLLIVIVICALSSFSLRKRRISA